MNQLKLHLKKLRSIIRHLNMKITDRSVLHVLVINEDTTKSQILTLDLKTHFKILNFFIGLVFFY
jgi:hypothetical protein